MKNEKRKQIKGKNNELETLQRIIPDTHAAIVLHPHPAYGGSMYNNVVKAVTDYFAEKGYSTLRFNFRSVGMSTGEHGGGLLEIEDLITACRYLKDNLGENTEIVVAGYSFGSYVLYNAFKEKLEIKKAILISPPLKAMEFIIPGYEINLKPQVIVGDNDEYCSVEEARNFCNSNNFNLSILPDTDHFYHGKEKDLIKEIDKCFG